MYDVREAIEKLGGNCQKRQLRYLTKRHLEKLEVNAPSFGGLYRANSLLSSDQRGALKSYNTFPCVETLSTASMGMPEASRSPFSSPATV